MILFLILNSSATAIYNKTEISMCLAQIDTAFLRVEQKYLENPSVGIKVIVVNLRDLESGSR